MRGTLNLTRPVHSALSENHLWPDSHRWFTDDSVAEEPWQQAEQDYECTS